MSISIPGYGSISSSNPNIGQNQDSGDQGGASLEVVIGTVDIDDLDDWYEEQAPESFVMDFRCTNKFVKDTHTYMGGLTSPLPFQSASAAFVRLAAPTVKLVCDWTVSKWGTKTMPDSTAPPGWVLIDQIPIETAMMRVADDGATPLWRISGIYVFGRTAPGPLITDDVWFPRPPWIQNKFDRTISPGVLADGLINLNGSTTQAGG
jgi:hypothetical protein